MSDYVFVIVSAPDSNKRILGVSSDLATAMEWAERRVYDPRDSDEARAAKLSVYGPPSWQLNIGAAEPGIWHGRGTVGQYAIQMVQVVALTDCERAAGRDAWLEHIAEIEREAVAATVEAAKRRGGEAP